MSLWDVETGVQKHLVDWLAFNPEHNWRINNLLTKIISRLLDNNGCRLQACCETGVERRFAAPRHPSPQLNGLQTVSYKRSHPSSCPIMLLLNDVPQPLKLIDLKRNGFLTDGSCVQPGKMSCKYNLGSLRCSPDPQPHGSGSTDGQMHPHTNPLHALLI